MKGAHAMYDEGEMTQMREAMTMTRTTTTNRTEEGNSRMRMLAATFGLAALAAGVVYYYQNFAGRPARAAEVVAVDPLVERGRYLVTIQGCNDCHTPLK